MVVKSLQAIFLLSLLSLGVVSYSLPLSTLGNIIIDSASGQRVKLACTAWAAHLEPMLAEGLDKQPLKDIVAKVVQLGFNCVRLTWATYMFTRFNQSTVTQTLDSLKLTQAKEGIAKNNPAFLKMTHIQAFVAVVDELGRQGLMVVLDNHVSSPKWCCDFYDDDGFFGDADFDPNEWGRSLITVALGFYLANKKQVVALSLRNELRGRRLNPPDWYKYISVAAEQIHSVNPDVLVLVPGLNFDEDLTFLKNKPLGVNLGNKLVYESHWWYSKLDSGSSCESIQKRKDFFSGFVTGGDNPTPLFLGAFGIDQTGTNETDERYKYINCLLQYVATHELSWSLWALQGSYYLREGQLDYEEVYGVLKADWSTIRNRDFLSKLGLVRGLKYPTSSIMFHPDSGSCVRFSNQSGEIYADSSCVTPIRWIHTREGAPLRLMGTHLCLKVVGDGLAPVVSPDCTSQHSLWYSVSGSKLNLAAKDQNGQYLCLDKTSSNSTQILTRKCICINDDPGCLDNPKRQWFTLASKNVPSLRDRLGLSGANN